MCFKDDLLEKHYKTHFYRLPIKIFTVHNHLSHVFTCFTILSTIKLQTFVKLDTSLEVINYIIVTN